MGRQVNVLSINEEQRAALQKVMKTGLAPQRDVRRARIILLRAEGRSQAETAELCGVSRQIVIQWEKRFRDAGVAGLAEGQRSGRKPSLPEEIKAQIISEATRPPAGRGRWSVRSMARAKGVSVATVHKLWNSNDIKPHLVRTF